MDEFLCNRRKWTHGVHFYLPVILRIMFVFFRLERFDWMAQAEQLKHQTLATLSERDHQLRQLTALLEEARTHRPKLQQEHYQREVGAETWAGTGFLLFLSQCEISQHQLSTGLRESRQSSWSPAGAKQPAGHPQLHGRGQRAAAEVECKRVLLSPILLCYRLKTFWNSSVVVAALKLWSSVAVAWLWPPLYIRLDEETQQRMAAEEQLMVTQDGLKRYVVVLLLLYFHFLGSV